MPETRDFHISDILSITTGRAVSITGKHVIDGIYGILNFMCHENLMTHQLPRAMREAAPVLLAQHPNLALVDASAVNPDNWRDWVARQEAQFGRDLPVTAMAADEHVARDALAEAIEMFGEDRIVIVQV